MKRIPKTLAVLFLVYASITPSRTLSAETCNRVVAVVNNEVITQYELDKRVREVTGFSPEALRAKAPERFSETRRQVLHLMIDEKIAEEKIKELNIQVTQKQVDATIQRMQDNQRMSREELLAELQKEGLTYEKFEQKIRKDLERARLVEYEVKSKIIIRDEAVKEYYERNKKDFGSVEKIHLACIFLILKSPSDPAETMEIQRKAEDILSRLRAGEDFGEMAKKYSEGAAASSGGDLGVFHPDQLDPQLRKIIEALKVGSVSGLIPRQNGIQIFKVLERQEGEIKPLDEVKDAIYSILYREEVESRYRTWIQGLRESSYTRILTDSL